MKKSIFGLGENIVGALAYLFGFFSGIVALVMEKENKYVRFHALQSTIWFLFLFVIGWMLTLLIKIPVLGILFSPVGWAVGVANVVSKIALIFMALQGKEFKLPIVGDVVWAQVNK